MPGGVGLWAVLPTKLFTRCAAKGRVWQISMAAIGPCIAPASYEVGAEFRQQFLAQDAANERFFLASPIGKPDHYHFALAQYLTARLESAGIRSISSVDDDTAADEKKYFSWRRTCWHKQTQYGRMIGVISLG